MNKLTTAKRAQILQLLCEGMSMRATSRVADCSINTVTKLLVDAGNACREYQDKAIRNLKARRVQVDEIWSFVGMKQRTVPENQMGSSDIGDVWTWTALDADSKLMITWLIGGRDAGYAKAFMDDVAWRLRYRVQLTSDGHPAYLSAVESAFGGDVDYAQLVKKYGPAPEGQRRYSPPICLGADIQPVTGAPDSDFVSTSYVERANLTIRMMNRRFTRLTNAFSKKVENHDHAFSLFAMHYNFARIHKTLKVTPAMEAGIADHVWSMEQIVEMVEAATPKAGKRGPYKKRGNKPVAGLS